MTSLTTILALTPLALGFGDGAELRRPMAIAVISGLISSTALTLVIIPTLYAVADRLTAGALRPAPDAGAPHGVDSLHGAGTETVTP